MSRTNAHGTVGSSAARILPLELFENELGGLMDSAWSARIDAIFFGASSTESFPDEIERRAFRERWLGRYLDRYRRHFFLAVDVDNMAIGYLAGCLEDPANQPLFSDIRYFSVLGYLTRLYPAHLHINLDPAWRGRGIGAQMIEEFCGHAAVFRCSGVHVVTGERARNVSFYTRCGFQPLHVFDWDASRLVMLGRRLNVAQTE